MTCHCTEACNGNRLSASDIAREGRESLRAHIADRADAAREKYGALNKETLPSYLADQAFVRRPTRLVFEFGEMAPHQFGDAEPDPRDPEQSVVLYVRPVLKQHPDMIPLAVAYLVPTINYGDMATDEDCLFHGARLLGLTVDEYYKRLCDIADFVGAEPHYPSQGCQASH